MITSAGADIPGDPTGASESLVTAKLSVPTARHLVVPRARLFARLSRGVTGPLTVVSAAAGSGKTTLAASWVAAGLAPGRVAWLTLDAHDDQPGVFWTFVVASLRRHGVLLPASVGVPLRPDEVERSFLAELAVALADRVEPVIVVLDQFDLLSNAAVSRDLDFVLQHAAPGLRLVGLIRNLHAEFEGVALAQESRRIRLHHQVFRGDGVVFEESTTNRAIVGKAKETPFGQCLWHGERHPHDAVGIAREMRKEKRRLIQVLARGDLA